MKKEVIIKTTVGTIGFLGLVTIIRQKISNKIWKATSAGSILVAGKLLQENSKLREELKELKSSDKVEVAEV